MQSYQVRKLWNCYDVTRRTDNWSWNCLQWSPSTALLLFFFFMAYSHCKLKNLPSKIGCRESPVCFCGFHNETAEHFFLERPLYYIPETNLLFSAARIFAERLSSMSKAQILAVFLFGSSLLSPEQNNDLIFHVQSFVSMRFYKSASKYVFSPASIPLISSLFCCRYD